MACSTLLCIEIILSYVRKYSRLITFSVLSTKNS
uniref:Uncharacterized protein n=1 Tax=Brassica oleracea TaxID=3712 RepID=A0A3P6DGR1_BRAOL|nr:unnamed protein product [Brassica oleracea]